ncbi:MAG: hypothetical protein ACRDTJ_11420, partial [Pseudonocardiaceae bacterium]
MPSPEDHPGAEARRRHELCPATPRRHARPAALRRAHQLPVAPGPRLDPTPRKKTNKKALDNLQPWDVWT